MNQPLCRKGALIGSLCVALCGCAQTSGAPRVPPGLVASPCTPGVCTIQVFVDRCNAADGIRLDRPLVEVTSAVNMHWEIVTPGFEFASNGIEFDPTNPQFEPRNSPRPNEFRIHNKKTAPGDYYYFVNVKGCMRHDPWIRNR
jgi:hypothetical protein